MAGQIDPFTLALFRNAITSLGDEMALTIYRTSYSGVLKDIMDYSTALCDPQGRLVAQGLTLAGHLCSIPVALKAELARLGVLGRARGAEMPATIRSTEARSAVSAGVRRAYFGPDAGWHDTPLIGRHALSVSPRPGPLIVEEYDATIVVPPGASARRDTFDNVLIDT